MTDPTKTPNYVVGPYGTVLTRADLPSSKPGRWVVRRKAELVAAVRGGLISLEEACERYDLTVEEFLNWHHAVERFGVEGLHVANLRRSRPRAGKT